MVKVMMSDGGSQQYTAQLGTPQYLLFVKKSDGGRFEPSKPLRFRRR